MNKQSVLDMCKTQVSSEQAGQLCSSGFWKDGNWSLSELIRLQIAQPYEVIPLPNLHSLIEKALRRPVYQTELVELEDLFVEVAEVAASSLQAGRVTE